MNQKQDKHIVDILFVIGLFCIFALSSFFLISIGANIYRKTVAHMDENFNTRTSLSYVVEKVRQADAEGAVSIGTFEGNPAVILSSEVNGIEYHTYIYEYQGMLKELMERSDISLSATAGQDILAMDRFEITAVNDHLVQCTMKTPEENTISFYICIRSGGFEDADEKFF